MQFIIADTFTRSLARLDRQSQGLIKLAVFDFQTQPETPGFQLHRLDKGKEKNFWSARVSSDLRMIVHRTEGSATLCYVDHHDAAYAWAERRRFEVHPQTGAAQIVEMVERQEAVVVTKGVELLFGRYEADYLLALGVPTEWLDSVRAADWEGLDKLIAHLPAEAAERLLQLAAGQPVPRPVKPAEATPFTHPDAQRRFRVVDNQRELQQALDAPWEQWLVFLHPTQRAAVERSYKGPALVSGSAGTGKTVVALHRAAHLLRAGGRILLTTYSRTLAARLAQSAGLLLGEEAKGLRIEPLLRVARELLQQLGKRGFTAVNARQLQGMMEYAAQVIGKGQVPVALLRAEWEAIVDPQGLADWDSYRKASRAGRGTALGAKQKLVIWKCCEQVRADLRAQRLVTWSQLCHEVVALIEASGTRPFDHVVVDESQDFGPAELRLLRALVRPGANDLFLCGDAGQRIYRGRFSWISVGIDVRGRATRLRLNYRTTEQIRRFADGLLPEMTEESDGTEEKRATVSLLRGPTPEVRGAAGAGEESALVAEWLKPLLAEGYQARDIAIFARTEAVLRERAEPALQLCGLRGRALDDEEPVSAADVALGTMHRAKGLEFKVVVVLGCEEGLLPLASVLKDIDDEADREAYVEQERQLLYVACTRSRERLLVTFTGKRSGLLR